MPWTGIKYPAVELCLHTTRCAPLLSFLTWPARHSASAHTGFLRDHPQSPREGLAAGLQADGTGHGPETASHPNDLPETCLQGSCQGKEDRHRNERHLRDLPGSGMSAEGASQHVYSSHMPCCRSLNGFSRPRRWSSDGATAPAWDHCNQIVGIKHIFKKCLYNRTAVADCPSIPLSC